MNSVHFSYKAGVFHGRRAPEEGIIVGYAAIINSFELEVPTPDIISLISSKNRKYKTEGWNVLTPKHAPEDTLYKHLVFALKYEGVHLLFFKKLFLKLSSKQIYNLLKIEPTGHYTRRIWFLYEWLLDKELQIPNADIKIKYTPLLDEKLQYAISGENSSRHRITNNLPGTIGFCPLIFKTKKLVSYAEKYDSAKKADFIKNLHSDVLQRASAFLLLKDSKASFSIEGENPRNNRAMRWGKAIGQAGSKPLTTDELLRLQQIVIENSRFTHMGFREEGGFVGEHDRQTGEPIPEHISAKAEDVEPLINSLIATGEKLEKSEFNPVLASAIVAFGFVFIHPFEDGNGRVHRYLIHHILAKMKFAQQGVIFPVSAAILNHIEDYRKTLESYSHPLLDLIKWKQTENNNVEVLNETADYYRYFDATKQAEFLYDCVQETIDIIIPNEVSYLLKYDEMKRFLDDNFEMPDRMVATLVRFLEQNAGTFSNRAKKKEFKQLNEKEQVTIEKKFKEIFIEA
ncbi:Fic family protein [Zunongwangia sp. F260]|uniref:Fic family protein n=1 Tax=Autumnicola lenta TaxID=3075593 RepID=A0ABU3CHS8_9FLAO|nr:Fic family protein [Zunongwangia sp. F260]MDT0645893.1 Fic family protein [Zunongwangia sp. F260]